MDERVLDAMARWPNVPAVSGWLSLTSQGEWRLHPDGLGHQAQNGALPVGEPIANPQILQFLARNYGHDHLGRWFFQNGPQRVYVRLDAAPYILRTVGDNHSLCLQTHTNQPVSSIHRWWLDSLGRLFAETDHGPGLIAGRDTADVLDCLQHNDGTDLTELPDVGTPREMTLRWRLCSTPEAQPIEQHGPMRTCQATDLPKQLGFVPLPQA